MVIVPLVVRLMAMEVGIFEWGLGESSELGEISSSSNWICLQIWRCVCLNFVTFSVTSVITPARLKICNWIGKIRCCLKPYVKVSLRSWCKHIEGCVIFDAHSPTVLGAFRCLSCTTVHPRRLTIPSAVVLIHCWVMLSMLYYIYTAQLCHTSTDSTWAFVFVFYIGSSPRLSQMKMASSTFSMNRRWIDWNI